VRWVQQHVVKNEMGANTLGVPADRSGRAFRSYCTGFNHGPVSASLPNAENKILQRINYSFIFTS